MLFNASIVLSIMDNTLKLPIGTIQRYIKIPVLSKFFRGWYSREIIAWTLLGQMNTDLVWKDLAMGIILFHIPKASCSVFSQAFI